MGSDPHSGTYPPQTPSRCSGFFLFDHDQPKNTHGYYVHGFNFSPTIPYRVYSFPTKKGWVHFPKKHTPRQKIALAHRQVATWTPHTLAES